MNRSDFNPADFDAGSCDETRNAGGRRRLIDLTTGDRDYSARELELLRAVEEFKRSTGRQFPTWGEVLEIARGLGDDRAGGGRLT